MDPANPDPDPPTRPPPSSAPKSNRVFLWKNLFSDSLVSPSPPTSTTYLEDGTPVVLAPSSVLLKSSEAWSGYIVCHFFGDAPSSTKIFSDLNPVWGRNGAISVRRFSNGSCLIHVPSVRTKQWILDIGLWSSGTVSFAVSEWPSVASLAPKKLTSASTILTFREVPPQLWSQIGIETIAGGIAKLIPNVKASLPLSSLGTATIRAIVPLGSALPSTVVIKDSQGDTVRIRVSFGRLPPLCPTCQNFGHQSHRCPSRRTMKTAPDSPIPTVPPLSTSMDLDDHLHSESQIPNLISNTNVESATDPPTTNLASQVPSSSARLLANTQSLDKAHKSEALLPPVDTSSLTSLAISMSPLSEHNIDGCKSSLDSLSCQMKATDTQSGLKESPPVHTHMDLDVSNAIDSQIIEISFPITPMSALEPSSSTMTSQVSSTSAQLIDQAPPAVEVSSPNDVDESALVKDLVTSNDEDKIVISPSEDDNMVPFSFPPLANHSLVDLGYGVCPVTHSDSSSLSLPVDSRTRREGNKAKRQQLSPIRTSLRCIMERHTFKPLGVVDKRKRKINQMILTKEEQVQAAFQEMKEDKTNTCLYDLIETHKIMKEKHSEAKGNSRESPT